MYSTNTTDLEHSQLNGISVIYRMYFAVFPQIQGQLGATDCYEINCTVNVKRKVCLFKNALVSNFDMQTEIMYS